MEKTTKKCPYCGGEILEVAKKCKHCGRWLNDNQPKAEEAPKAEPKPIADAKPTAPVASSGQEQQQNKPFSNLAILGIIAALIIVSFIIGAIMNS
ncbi:MAG: hypothetical protein HUJ98_09600 [Bacteroidaceae bacterium]|nr:hypothetical protein [Bacteroidaceae bacterium]